MRLTLFTDGGSRGNPGPAGIGAVLYDEEQQEVHAISQFIGRETNNVAEYRALEEGLKAAHAHGAAYVDIRMDSQLIVRQLSGQYRVKNAGLRPIFQRVQALLEQFEGYTCQHVPRAQNVRADALANQAMDRKR